MISRRALQVEDRTVLISPDDAVPDVDRIQALVKIRLTDEMAGGLPAGRITIEVREQRLVPRVASGGIAGLVGIPRQVFPGLQTIDYFVHLRIRAERYIAIDLEVKLPKNPAFPADFTAPDIAVELHRQPVVVFGRTVRVVGNGAVPVPGAVVKLTGIWRTPPPANIAVAPAPPNLISIQPPLYSERAPLTQLLRRTDLVPVLGNDKVIMDNLVPGAGEIRISDRQGLAPGNVLAIDVGQPDLVEFIAIKTVPTTAPANQPTLVSLDYPLSFEHRRGAVVRQVTLQPPGPNIQVAAGALPGDVCVFTSGLAGLAAAQHIQIRGAPGPDEYHKPSVFSITSDPDGYYRLPPLSRVAQVEVEAEKTLGGQTFKTTKVFRPDYDQFENQLDFTLVP